MNKGNTIKKRALYHKTIGGKLNLNKVAHVALTITLIGPF